MYADRLEQAAKISVKERLNRDVLGDSDRGRSLTGKRLREDSRWERDLYEDDRPQFSKTKVQKADPSDIWSKLQKMVRPQAVQKGGARDLRKKLSSTTCAQPVDDDYSRPKPMIEATKPAKNGQVGQASLAESRKVSASSANKKSQQEGDATTDGFLESLGLEKYQLQFRVEEVDMMALEQMTDEDLKAMGLPMGPRKKILSALSSSRSQNIRLTGKPSQCARFTPIDP